MKPRVWFGKPVSPSRVPLKANVFETLVDHQGMLQQKPLFPYLGPGDIAWPHVAEALEAEAAEVAGGR
jgi:hypothetical protein